MTKLLKTIVRLRAQELTSTNLSKKKMSKITTWKMLKTPKDIRSVNNLLWLPINAGIKRRMQKREQVIEISGAGRNLFSGWDGGIAACLMR